MYFKNIFLALAGRMPVEIKEVEIEAKDVKVTVEPCNCHEELQELVKNEADLRKQIIEHKKTLEKAEEAHKKALVNQLDQAEKALRKVKEAMEDAKLAHKISVEDIKHMHSKLEEKAALDNERAIFDAEKKADEEIREIRKTYAEKLEKELQVEREKMQGFMNQVMAALPNVNVQMGKPLKED